MLVCSGSTIRDTRNSQFAFAVSAALDIKVHPHMIRHACGFALANQGRDTRGLQAYLGHWYIQHTVRYTELSSDRFRCWWKD